MTDHPVDRFLKKDAYYQGAIWCFISLNIFTLIVFCLDFKLINFLIAFGFLVIFMIRGETFISELKKSNFFKRKFIYFLIIDSFITFICGFVFPIFFIFKVFTLVWFFIMVSENWNEEREL